MKKIVLIIAYFGKWPTWFPAFLQSCKYNPGIDWILFTDCEIPDVSLNNVKFVPFTIEDFNLLSSQKLGFAVNLPFIYKMCDFKPTFGVVFADYIKDYEFWGHCDLDIVWGDIRTFINDDILEKYEIISAGKETISGHFCLYLNNSKINQLFTRCPYYQAQLLSSEHCCFDESAMTNLVNSLSQKGKITVFWDQWLVNYPNLHKPMPAARLGRHLNRWHWQSGKLYNQNHEIMYMHFMTWKKSLLVCNVDYQDDYQSFYISYSHIGLSKSDNLTFISQATSLIALYKTLFDFDYQVWHRRIDHYIIKKLRYKRKKLPQVQSVS